MHRQDCIIILLTMNEETSLNMLPWCLHLLRNKIPSRGGQYPVNQLTAQHYDFCGQKGLLKSEVLSYNIALSTGQNNYGDMPCCLQSIEQRVGKCKRTRYYVQRFVHRVIYGNNYPTRCNNIQYIYICKMLYVFRVVSPPIIRSSSHCICIILY